MWLVLFLFLENDSWFKDTHITDPLEILRRRIVYRSSHRGTKELDFILGRFCMAFVNEFDVKQLELFERLLENEETHLQQWLMGQVDIPAGSQGEMLHQIRAFHLAELSQENGSN